jgi:hypothetical protein
VRAIVAALAGALFFYFERPVVAYVAWSVGALTLLLAIVSPLGAYAALERAVAKVGLLVGTALSWLLLAPVFFLFVLPFGLLTRRGAKDPLKRAFERDAPSYWKKREHDRANLDRPY